MSKNQTQVTKKKLKLIRISDFKYLKNKLLTMYFKKNYSKLTFQTMFQWSFDQNFLRENNTFV